MEKEISKNLVLDSVFFKNKMVNDWNGKYQIANLRQLLSICNLLLLLMMNYQNIESKKDRKQNIED
ncbi:hypothetical protein BpHYR1_017770 [Brachionus plicatilis]|uniref:Uncharacterized protein n=1 Tax=Brachionus plicatilis TaxID=10195 RepID=A0A3M7PFN4_BRAPC|nr:hypothetical protein BpHYR1_017770 [Brachionus plicatilis]